MYETCDEYQCEHSACEQCSLSTNVCDVINREISLFSQICLLNYIVCNWSSLPTVRYCSCQIYNQLRSNSQ